MRPRIEPCGCQSADTQWTRLCAQHKHEHDDLHARAQREHFTNVGGAGSANPEWIAEMARIETEDA